MAPYRPLHNATNADHADARVVIMDGERWTVYESRLGQYDRRSRPHLFFESDSAVRRVREYPSNWRELSDEELARLSGQR